MAGGVAGLWFLSKNPTTIRPFEFSLPKPSFAVSKPNLLSLRSIYPSPSHNARLSTRLFGLLSCKCSSTVPVTTRSYEFSDGSSEIELRIHTGGRDILSPRDILVDANYTSLAIRVQRPGSLTTLIETNRLFDKIKPDETIWYIDDDQLVVNLKKQDPDLKWPDITESWESLTVGSAQLLKGTSVYLVGDSTEINQKVARELATGLGYALLCTKELMETYSRQTIDSWVLAEGIDSVAKAESSVLESLSSHVRAVVATLGGQQGAAGRADKWQHLYAGFTIWLSQTEAIDEDSAREETHKNIEDGRLAYTNSDVVVKLQGWDPAHAKSVAQACLSALKQSILSDKNLPETWESKENRDENQCKYRQKLIPKPSRETKIQAEINTPKYRQKSIPKYPSILDGVAMVGEIDRTKLYRERNRCLPWLMESDGGKRLVLNLTME